MRYLIGTLIEQNGRLKICLPITIVDAADGGLLILEAMLELVINGTTIINTTKVLRDKSTSTNRSPTCFTETSPLSIRSIRPSPAGSPQGSRKNKLQQPLVPQLSGSISHQLHCHALGS